MSIARRPYRRRATPGHPDAARRRTSALPTRSYPRGAFFAIAIAGWVVKKLRKRAAANR
ncbi:MAG TPA: hypothetical protein VGQ92_28930 [Actinoplanes sp.]|nr:hypothetical protein [Actinoplanes sp.]